MAVWFEGAEKIECSIELVKVATEDLGEYYAGVVGFMPGLTSIELVEQGSDHVTIRTNEGLMRRTGISRNVEDERVVVTLREEYQAGKMVTVKSSIRDEFTVDDKGVQHRLIISDVTTRGLLGFFYRIFGRSSTGKAFLAAHKTYFEQVP